MASTINSAFDVLSGLTVDEMLANPAFLPEIMKQAINGEEVQRLFFRTITVNSNVIAYKEAAPAYLEDDLQNVAEYGEIPVSDPSGDEWQTVMLEKGGIGIRVSWEQRQDDNGDAVQREMISRTNTILRSEAKAGLAAIAKAPISTHQAAVAWDQAGAKPASDILDTIELIQGAEDAEGHYYEYEPSVLWIHPTTLSMLKRNDEVQKLYIGDMAHANPLFNGVADEPQLFGNIQVAKSFFVPKGEAYLSIEGVGFMGEREPRQITDFYAERGDSDLGGANMSWRSDVSHRRGYAVDNPKGIIKLTGLVTP
ncbi:hypothetical protein [Corynebacterium vitaeruminis]|uniref:phage major capsid protein n=1 Tax=Corynebacterium vitaeruminis TaxID=38305 RepID=UPI0023EFB9CE|nr:hypothetical protein [Corynebacterium vitaeruminis]